MPLQIEHATGTGTTELQYESPAHHVTVQTPDTVQNLTIAGGSVTPALVTTTVGIIANLIINGEGGAADDLDSLVLDANWIGRLIMIRKKSTSGAITIKHSASIVTKTDFTEDADTDIAVYLCTAVNTIIQIARSDNA
jgi:hypothetical protein